MSNAARHPITNEAIPPGGFRRLPDGRELRDRLSAAHLLGFKDPSNMTLAVEKFDLTVFESAGDARPGRAQHFYLLDELLAVKAERQRMIEAGPTEFKLRRQGSVKVEGSGAN